MRGIEIGAWNRNLYEYNIVNIIFFSMWENSTDREFTQRYDKLIINL